MTKKLILLALALVCASAFVYKAYAKNVDTPSREIGLSVEVGADVVSSYLWRGQNLGGLAIQPSITLDWKGLYVSGWGNIGADNWTFENLNPELDITIGYDNYGLQLDLTHLYYFGGESYFPKGGFKAQEIESSSTMEAHAGFHLGDLVESVPLAIDWYTTIYGADCYLNEAGEWQRAWSTYIQVGYTFNLPLGVDLTTNVGFTPWRGMYSNYDEVWKNAKTVAINNLHLRAERYFELKGIELGVWGECMLNCYGLDKTNLTTALENKFDQRFNWGVGGCLYFSSEW
ncbi:MAG: hypothetical protein IKT71_02785 [Paludibacteraceae bacterium]|nr:hypothetical protein [Paludibacteraceae bacterium]